MRNFHLPLPERLYRRLREVAEATNRPATVVARYAIESWLRPVIVVSNDGFNPDPHVALGDRRAGLQRSRPGPGEGRLSWRSRPALPA